MSSSSSSLEMSWGVSTCLQPKAQFCKAACAKPVPSFAKFHGDCCPGQRGNQNFEAPYATDATSPRWRGHTGPGSWKAAATPKMTDLRDDCCDCK
jgi:hypothetical protein